MKTVVILIALSGLMSVVGCGNKVNFSGMEQVEAVHQAPVIIPNQPDDPVIPPPVVVEPPPVVVEPPPVVPPMPLQLKSGVCSVSVKKDVLSCLDCESSSPVIPPPLLSRKAQELLEIMTAGCSIRNKSDPSGYMAPTHEELLKRVIQCSPTAYPDTAFQATQEWTINRLLTNRGAQQSAFGGLYYNSASTDFETYFGLEIGEARYAFCHGQQSFGIGGVYPKEYYDAINEGRPYNLPSIYVKAQRIRQTLRNCLAESLRNPNPAQQPTIPGIACSYETAEGDMSQLVIDKVNEWQNQGHVVYFEGFNQCGVLEDPEKYLDQTTSVKIAIKKCQ